MPRIPPEGRRFQPGQSGNPSGARKHDQAKKIMRKLTALDLEEIINLVLNNDMEALLAIKNDLKNTKVLKAWVAAAAIEGIKKGDLTSLTTLVDRIFGRVSQKIELSGALEHRTEDPELRKARIEENLKKRALISGN